MTLATLRSRRDTAANWASANPILSLGEIGWETDQRRGKIGDGSTVYNSLPYTVGQPSAQGYLDVTAPPFGAKGDGSTDDTAAIQAALDASVGGGTVLLPGLGPYMISNTIEVPNGVMLKGYAGHYVTSGLGTIKATAAFPLSTPMVRLGKSTDSLAFGSRVEDLTIDANARAAICLYSTALQELSGGSRLQLIKYTQYGLHLNGATNSAYRFAQMHVYSALGASGAMGVRADSNGFGVIDTITVNTSDATLQAKGIYVNGSNLLMQDIHVEKHTIGVEFNGGGAGGSLQQVNGINVTNLVQVNTSTTLPITIMGIHKGTGVTTALNVLSGTSISGDVALWTRGTTGSG